MNTLQFYQLAENRYSIKRTHDDVAVRIGVLYYYNKWLFIPTVIQPLTQYEMQQIVDKMDNLHDMGRHR